MWLCGAKLARPRHEARAPCRGQLNHITGPAAAQASDSDPLTSSMVKGSESPARAATPVTESGCNPAVPFRVCVENNPRARVRDKIRANPLAPTLFSPHIDAEMGRLVSCNWQPGVCKNREPNDMRAKRHDVVCKMCVCKNVCRRGWCELGGAGGGIGGEYWAVLVAAWLWGL